MFSFSALAGCSRARPGDAVGVRIRTPSTEALHKAGAQSYTLPADKQPCFGVHVTGSGISATQANSCAPTVGVAGGFVGPNQELSLSVPRGSGRNFELLVVLTEPGENCPALDASFLGKNENVYRTYVAGRAFNVNLDSDNATVDIILDFPGLMASMGEARNSVCQPQATLRGSLLSNGDIVTAGGITDSFLSSPINFSYYKTGLGDTRAVGVMATSGELNLFAGQSFTLPPYVLSVTRKPDSGMYIGMVADGSLVQIIPNGADSTAVPLNAASCPFFTSNCQVPPWMQSLSAGFGGRLYGLDHGGQVYEIGAQGPVFTGLTMPAVVSQVSFY